MTAVVTLEQRKSILSGEIDAYLRKGFRVLNQTDTTAQLLRPKHFSFLWALLWFLLLGVGLLVYLFYYMSKKDEQIYISVDEQGAVTAR